MRRRRIRGTLRLPLLVVVSGTPLLLRSLLCVLLFPHLLFGHSITPRLRRRRIRGTLRLPLLVVVSGTPRLRRRRLSLLPLASLFDGEIGTPRTLERTLLVAVPLLHLFRVRRLGTYRRLALCSVLGHAGGVLSGILDALGLARHAR